MLESLIGKLIDLAKHRATRDSRVMNEIVSPMFDELLVVHKDYIEAFERTKALLESKTIDDITALREAEDYLLAKRLDGEATREKLIAACHALDAADHLSRKFGDFVQLVYEYFGCLEEGDRRHQVTRAKALVVALRNLREGIERGESSREAHILMFNRLNKALDGVRIAWSEVCEEYAKLRIGLLT